MYSELAGRYASRDDAYWRARFGGDFKGLRVLIPTSRYTTYLKYSCDDLRRALEQMGCECKVIMEPDDQSTFSASAYLRAMESFDPDLVVTLNYPRSTLAGRIPPGVPYVCWIQDAMVHLFDEERGKAIDDREFLVGMIHPELADRFGYPQNQMQWMPMPASATKFSQCASTPNNTCEIAWVTHQSEPVDVQCARLLDMVREHFPQRTEQFAELFSRIRFEMGTDPTRFVFTWLDEIADACLFPDQDAGAMPIFRANAMHGMVFPIAERIFRHQTLRWAIRIAEKHNWRVRVFGNGWDQNPEFAKYAAGPVAHGSELHECYRDAAVHLHASLHQPMHQRVSECLLSGGLPLVRVARDAFAMMNDAAVLEAQRSGAGTRVLDGQQNQTALRVNLADCPAGRKMIECMKSLGVCSENEFVESMIQWPMSKVQAAIQSDQSLAQRENTTRFSAMSGLFFATEQGFEELLVHAINDSAWREKKRSTAQTTLPDVYTMEGFAKQML
ncbi:MAG: hypothetical protein JKY96_01680, partial [Phycisphaerales bacterium]|nr:hypothetical protein [Phycisphaerales bacterium]